MDYNEICYTAFSEFLKTNLVNNSVYFFILTAKTRVMSCAVFVISLPSFIDGLYGYSFQLLGDIAALFVFVSE